MGLHLRPPRRQASKPWEHHQHHGILRWLTRPGAVLCGCRVTQDFVDFLKKELEISIFISPYVLPSKGEPASQPAMTTD